MASDTGFDQHIHAPTRLRVCGLLRPVDTMTFATLRSALQLSEANLSKTLQSLTALTYVRVTKDPTPSRGDARRITTVALTAEGRAAFDGHIAALRRIANGLSG